MSRRTFVFCPILLCAAFACFGFTVAAAPQQRESAVPETPAARVRQQEAVPAQAVPRLVKYGGTLREANGTARTGTVGVVFAVYADQNGGAPLWMETQNVSLDEAGKYSTLLGAVSNGGVPLDLFSSGEPRWLGVQVQVPDEPEQPRVLLVSVPYALKASDADTLGGRPATEYLLRSQLGTSLLATPELAQSAGLTRAPATGGQVVDCTTNCTTNALSKFSSATTLTASLFSDNGTRITAGGGIDFSSDFSFVGNAAPAATGRVQLFDKAFQGFVIRGLNIIFETLQPAATEVLRITQSGNVGIGTATPSAPLEVAGTLKLSGANPAIVFTNGTTITPTQNASTQTHGIVYLAGCDSCSPLAPNDGQRNIYTNVVGTMTIQQVTCFSDTAAPGPIINLQRDSGTQANILSADLTCSTTGAIAPLLVGAQSILNVNDKIDFVMVTPGGTAKRATVVIKATLN